MVINNKYTETKKTWEALAVGQQEDTIKRNTIFIVYVYVRAYSDVPNAANTSVSV